MKKCGGKSLLQYGIFLKFTITFSFIGYFTLQ